eukprot:1147566-Pelagomonas_calceolata.AAC.1
MAGAHTSLEFASNLIGTLFKTKAHYLGLPFPGSNRTAHSVPAPTAPYLSSTHHVQSLDVSTHMLCADDLCITSNLPDQLQLMLDRLHTYAQRKGLVINAAKSENVHFNSRGDNMPVFMFCGARLACADSYRYLGMLFTKQRNFQ